MLLVALYKLLLVLDYRVSRGLYIGQVAILAVTCVLRSCRFRLEIGGVLPLFTEMPRETV